MMLYIQTYMSCVLYNLTHSYIYTGRPYILTTESARIITISGRLHDSVSMSSWLNNSYYSNSCVLPHYFAQHVGNRTQPRPMRQWLNNISQRFMTSVVCIASDCIIITAGYRNQMETSLERDRARGGSSSLDRLLPSLLVASRLIRITYGRADNLYTKQLS